MDNDEIGRPLEKAQDSFGSLTSEDLTILDNYVRRIPVESRKDGFWKWIGERVTDAIELNRLIQLDPDDEYEDDSSGPPVRSIRLPSNRSQLPSIFLSYRRDDTGLAIGRIAEKLISSEIEVFYDVDSLEPGSMRRVDFLDTASA